MTILGAWDLSYTTCPCSKSVHSLSFEGVENVEEEEEGGVGQSVQLLQYFARPIDRIIQAIAIPVFTTYLYLQAIRSESNASYQDIAMLLTPIVLPLLVSVSLIGSALRLLEAAMQLAIPVTMIYCVYQGAIAARQFDHLLKYYDPNENLYKNMKAGHLNEDNMTALKSWGHALLI